eukprot:scaffold58796_cov22-Tisochrysis_lutea.AAC.1
MDGYLVNDAVLDGLDADRVLVDAQHTRALTSNHISGTQRPLQGAGHTRPAGTIAAAPVCLFNCTARAPIFKGSRAWGSRLIGPKKNLSFQPEVLRITRYTPHTRTCELWEVVGLQQPVEGTPPVALVHQLVELGDAVGQGAAGGGLMAEGGAALHAACSLHST